MAVEEAEDELEEVFASGSVPSSASIVFPFLDRRFFGCCVLFATLNTFSMPRIFFRLA